MLEFVCQHQIIVEHRSEGALAVVLHQLLPVCHHDVDYLHDVIGHFHALIKVVEELLHLLDADAGLLDFKEDVYGPGLTVVSHDVGDFRLDVVEIKCSRKRRGVLLHDFILSFHGFLLNDLNLI